VPPSSVTNSRRRMSDMVLTVRSNHRPVRSACHTAAYKSSGGRELRRPRRAPQLDPDGRLEKRTLEFNLHVPLCCAAGATDTRYWQVVACPGAAHETATCRSFSTGAIGWHISNLKVDLGLHCGCRRHPHSGNGRL
jgi:hypothetical protein